MPKKITKLQTVEITAVIPTGQYANIQPKLVYQTESFEEAYAAGMPYLQRLSREFGEEGNRLSGSGSDLTSVKRELVKCYATGTEAFFDPIGHTYIDGNGNKYMSGSTFAHQFEHEFNKRLILPKSATKLGVSEQEVDEYWTSKADISTTFGTALHKALEHYGRYKELADSDIDYKTKQSKGTGIHPTLLPIVESFFEGREDEHAVYEPFVADERNLRCGFIDRLIITGEKRCIIGDYKTNGDLYKKGIPANLKAPYHYLPNVPLSKYMIQLSFYKAIMEAAGWTVEGLEVYWWNGIEWKTIPLKAVEIDMPQTKINLDQIV